jgi:RNA polymerase sigma-70 factor (ECF subfamily)
MDREAEFGRLYEAHRAAVHAYFVGRTGDRWVAAELMQDVFLRAWQQLPTLVRRDADGQRAWLFTVARNASIDAYRRQRTAADTVTALRAEPVPAAPSAHVAVVAADRLAVVNEAIATLPEQQRLVLAMTAAGGLNSSQIADALGVPAGTVRYRLATARAALAEALAGYDEPSSTAEES